MQIYEVVPNPNNRYGNTPFSIRNNQTGRIFGNFFDRDSATSCIARREWEESLPISLQTSFMLAEARTVLSRARTALQSAPVDGAKELNEEIMFALHNVVAILAKYERVGKAPKYPG